MTLKANKQVLLWSVIIWFFVFERAITKMSYFIGFIDEIFAICVVLLTALSIVRGKTPFNRDEWIILLMLLGICSIGIIGNLYSGLLKKPFPILIDIISMTKVWLAYYAVMLTHWKVASYDKLIIALAKVARALVWAMLLFLIFSHIVDVGMVSRSTRYGLSSFRFIFNNPGNFSKVFYFLVPLLTADLYYKKNDFKMITIGVSLFVWLSTLRVRAIAFVCIYLFAAFAFFFLNQKRKKKFLLRIIIPIAVLAVSIAWRQLAFYFTTDNQARAVLLRYGIVTMLAFFPLGSGLGTYGSDIAVKYYSPLYIKYGFNSYYGMREDETSFLNDNYWPMIMGQFGIFGTILMGIVVILFIRITLRATQNNRYFYFSALCASGFLLMSSVASKSYCEFSSICIFILIGLLVKRSREECKQSVNGPVHLNNRCN